ncbi:uncharacterized protein AB9X84_024056 isoform 1-T2 [Acanthopagrus schlegelii]
MNSLISVAVILQLVITGIKTDGKYQFGDIIEFPRKCIGKKPTYSHFAVYVGPESGVNVGQGDNDIFHRTAQRKKRYTCEFGKLDKTRRKSTDEKRNYLDDYIPAGDRTTDKIKGRIELKKQECGKYKVLTNNCEHLATFVRYNISLSLQNGTRAGCILKKQMDQAKLQEIQARIDEVRNRDLDTIEETDENNNTLCSNDASRQVSWWSVLSACVALCCLLSGSCGF